MLVGPQKLKLLPESVYAYGYEWRRARMTPVKIVAALVTNK